ncbi:MAG TPA: ATP-binding cassette domain-containing protein [Ktedonobacteraceae bacterium]|nr:ATP-binding cassette domain-containing protein [Ktedonobacteraceae bacterium]
MTTTTQPDHNQGQPFMPEQRSIPLDAPVITIGRLPDNMVVLNHPLVSGHHARIERMQNGRYRIVDLGSTNRTYINGQRLSRKLLEPGDVIRIAPYKFTFTGDQLKWEDESASIRIDALHLNERGSRRTILLDDITIDIPPRKLVALVGGSGVGKSTLLNALDGTHPAPKGAVLYNGLDFYQNLASFSSQIGIVPQDDIVHKNLTVEQALYFAARMRLPKDFTRAQIKDRIKEVLEDVGMTRRRKWMVRSLSGGERKRVSIALELLANPSVFFLDEPTSGLDPGLDLRMMVLLRQLADKGHTIVLVTHSIYNIDLCDYVCILAQGGRLAYYGPPKEAITYFGTSNFAEIYTQLEPTDENRNVPEEAEERFKQSPYYQKYVVQPTNQELKDVQMGLVPNMSVQQRKRGNPWNQFFLLSRRYTRLLGNDFGNLLILLLQAPVIGLILWFLATTGTFAPTSVTNCPTRANILSTSGPIVSIDCQRVVDVLKSPQATAILQQQGKTKDQVLNEAIAPNSGADAQTLLFIMAFAAVTFGCINGVREIVKEAPVYQRERAVNLGIAPYMFSKIVILGILCFIQSAIVIYIVNLKAPLHQGIFLPVFVEVYITMALASLAGLMLGLAISALAPNTDRAMSFVPIVLIPQVIFSGVIFQLDSPILQAIGSIFAMRWAMAGMGSSIGLHADKLGVDNFSYKGTLFVSVDKAAVVPGAIMHLLIVWGAMLLMIIVLGLATALFLKGKDSR